MSSTLADVADAYAGWLADTFDTQADWRGQRAEKFPDDGRNERSASALHAAVRYVRAIEKPLEHRGIRGFVDLNTTLDKLFESPWTPLHVIATFGDPDYGRPSIEFGDPGFRAEVRRESGRFFFDNGSRPPTARDFDLLINRTLDATLRDTRELIEGSGELPPDSVVEFFVEHGVSLWEDEGDDDA